MFQGHADNDAEMDADMDCGGPNEAGMAPPAESFIAGTFVAVLILFVVLMGWSDMVDSLNQMLAQIYLVSLVVAANG